ncbi:MAG: hypothetical protein AAGG01_22040 [Planctomycetota bacterium]
MSLSVRSRALLFSRGEYRKLVCGIREPKDQERDYHRVERNLMANELKDGKQASKSTEDPEPRGPSVHTLGVLHLQKETESIAFAAGRAA